VAGHDVAIIEHHRAWLIRHGTCVTRLDLAIFVTTIASQQIPIVTFFVTEKLAITAIGCTPCWRAIDVVATDASESVFNLPYTRTTIVGYGGAWRHYRSQAIVTFLYSVDHDTVPENDATDAGRAGANVAEVDHAEVITAISGVVVSIIASLVTHESAVSMHDDTKGGLIGVTIPAHLGLPIG
jgi:hypothetical protein